MMKIKLLSLLLIGALLLTGCTELSTSAEPYPENVYFQQGGLFVDGVPVDPVLTSNNVTTALGYTPSDNTATESKFRLLESRDIDWGWALSYDGNDYLSNATANFRSGDSQGAISGWFRSSSTATAQTLFCSSDTAGAVYYLKVGVINVTGRMFLIDVANNPPDYIQGSINVCDGKWHLLTWSTDGSTYTFLVDGVPEALNIILGGNNGHWFNASPTQRDNITIGAHTYTLTDSYAIADIGAESIYSRPMLSSEALTNYQRGRKATASDTTGLVYNLNLSEGTGNPVDKVGSLTMTINGNTKWTGFTARSPSFSGNVSFTSYGAGTLVTDANGKISVSSDARLKTILNTLSSGLRQVLNIDPVYFKWRQDSGMDTENTYLGFSAQDVMKYMPEAVGESSNGTLSLSDRALIAYLFQSIKELQDEIDRLNAVAKLPVYNRSMAPDLTGDKTIKAPKPSDKDLLGIMP